MASENKFSKAILNAFTSGSALVRNQFDLEENQTTIGRELLAGLLNFLVALPVFAVVPSILASAGASEGEVFTAAVTSSFLGTLLLAFVAKRPLVVVPSMSVAIFISYSVILEMGRPIAFAFLCCFAESVLFFIFSMVGLRDRLLSLIPRNLRYALSVGLGFWLIYVSLQVSGIITISENALPQMGSFLSPQVVACFIGVIATMIFAHWKQKAAPVYGFLIAWGLGIVFQLIGWYQVDETNASWIPTEFYALFEHVTTAGSCFDFESILGSFNDFASFALSAVMVTAVLLFMDLLDSNSGLLGIYPNEELNEKMPNLLKSKQVFASSSLASMASAVLGAPTHVIGKSSAMGLQVGGKTGLSALLTAVLLASLLFLRPFFSSIPLFAITPIVFYAGFMLLKNVAKISVDNISEAVPAWIMIAGIVFSTNVVYGFALGIVAFVLVNVGCGKIKKVSWLMWALALLSALFLIFV